MSVEPAAPPEPARLRESVPDVISAADDLARYADAVSTGTGPLALDAERASGFRYGQRAYLVQVRRAGAGTALIDPTTVPDLTVLQEATAGTEWVLHAATQDLPCLAEIGLRPTRLFDTELAGRLLGRERVSLAALADSELGLHLAKGHGATDWSARPLSAAQLRYAALDVEFLVELRDALAEALAVAGKTEIAREEFDALLAFTPREYGADAWRRTSGLHKVRSPRALAVVRELWIARDQIARRRDVAPGRVLPDAALVAAARALPATRGDLAAVPEFSGRGARRHLPEWWSAVAAALSTADLPATAGAPTGPPPPRTWAERDPAAHARLAAARSALAAAAADLNLPVENLLTPDTVRRLAWSPPEPIDAAVVRRALQSAGARDWQVDRTVDLLVTALTTAPGRPGDK